MSALAVGAVGVIITCSLTWATATVTVLGGTGSRVLSLSGGQAVPQAISLSIVALAGMLALLSLRSWARQLIGVLLIAVGLVIELGIIDFLRNPAIDAGNDTLGSIQTNLWWVLAGVCALIIIAAGAATAVLSRSWGGLGEKYEAEGVRKAKAMSPWDALSSGQDPTLTPQNPTLTPADPKLNIEPA